MFMACFNFHQNYYPDTRWNCKKTKRLDDENPWQIEGKEVMEYDSVGI
jgi:hypothetical protein